MKIPEAIKVLEDIIKYVRLGDPPEEHDALKLGIEALKTVQWNRTHKYPSNALRLPGETEE